MLRLNLGVATDRSPSLWRSQCFLPDSTSRLFYNRLRRAMAEQQKDPLLALVLSKLNNIEKAIDRLTEKVMVQNGRVTKLENVNEQELAIAKKTQSDIEAMEQASDRKLRKFIGLTAAAATVLAAIIAETVRTI